MFVVYEDTTVYLNTKKSALYVINEKLKGLNLTVCLMSKWQFTPYILIKTSC